MERPRSSEDSGSRGPSPHFLQRRHERMKSRSGASNDEEGEFKTLSVDISSEEKKMRGAISTASPTAIRSFRQLREKRRNQMQRVPGGAAAKLIGKTNEEDEKEDKDEADTDTNNIDDTQEEDLDRLPDDEFVRMRDEAKDAFEKGPKENKRYYEGENFSSDAAEVKVASANNSRVLNREEVLPDNPTAAVLSLIGKAGDGSGASMMHYSHGTDSSGIEHPSNKASPTSLRDFTKQSAMTIAPRHAFQAPPKRDGDGDHAKQQAAGVSQSMSMSMGIPEDDFETTAKGKHPLEQPLLSKQAELRVAQMKKQMKDPNATLANLISTIATPEDHYSGGDFTRGYMVRRKNACGALQVLSTTQSNRVSICWTVGVLPALSSVLGDSGNRNLRVGFPDSAIRDEFVEARKRAVSTILNLSMPPKNRLAVFYTPKLVANAIRVITMDQSEARQGCCAILAQLAKSKENRLLMVQVPGLIDAAISVIEPKDGPSYLAPEQSESEDSDDSTRAGDPEMVLSSRSMSEGSFTSGPFSSASYDSTDGTSMPSKARRSKLSKQSSDNLHGDISQGARKYDSEDEFLKGARLNIFALFSHLVKEKDNAYILARHRQFVTALIEISKLLQSPAHEYAVKILAHLTRHRANTKHFVFKVRQVIPVLVSVAYSLNDEARKHACFALQNISQDKPCRQELANAEGLLTALCVRVRQSSDKDERLAAIHAVKNMTDEPANLIPMTNTPECFATLMQIAHAGDDSVTEFMQFLGCDALATLSHWFRSIATSGHRIDLTKKGQPPAKNLFVPSLNIVAYEQWQ